MMLQLMQDVNTMSLNKFQADVLATRAQYEGSDAILGGMGAGWTPSFLSTYYPKASRNLIASFVKDIRKLSIGLILALYVTFAHENFVKGPANLFAQALADPKLDGPLTLTAMTYGRLRDLLVILRYSDKLQGASWEFNAQLEAASYMKMKDWRILLFQYLLQQNRSITGEDEVATGAGFANSIVACPCWQIWLYWCGSIRWLWSKDWEVRHGGVRTQDVICVPGRTSEGIQEFGVVCQLSLGCGLSRAELGGTEGAERVGQWRHVSRKDSGARMDVDGLQQQFRVPNGQRGPFPCPAEALESATNGKGFRRGDGLPE